MPTQPHITYTIYDVDALGSTETKAFDGQTAQVLIDVLDRFAGSPVAPGHYCAATRCGIGSIRRTQRPKV